MHEETVTDSSSLGALKDLQMNIPRAIIHLQAWTFITHLLPVLGESLLFRTRAKGALAVKSLARESTVAPGDILENRRKEET